MELGQISVTGPRVPPDFMRPNVKRLPQPENILKIQGAGNSKSRVWTDESVVKTPSVSPTHFRRVIRSTRAHYCLSAVRKFSEH